MIVGEQTEQNLAWHASQVLERVHDLVTAVHDQAAVDVVAAVQRLRDLPAPRGIDPVVAMATVMAAGLPADRAELKARLSWVNGLDAVPNRVLADDPSHDCDVHLLVAGRRVADQVPPAARRDAVAAMSDGTTTIEEIAERTGMHPRAVVRYRAQASKEAS